MRLRCGCDVPRPAQIEQLRVQRRKGRLASGVVDRACDAAYRREQSGLAQTASECLGEALRLVHNVKNGAGFGPVVPVCDVERVNDGMGA